MYENTTEDSGTTDHFRMSEKRYKSLRNEQVALAQILNAQEYGAYSNTNEPRSDQGKGFKRQRQRSQGNHASSSSSQVEPQPPLETALKDCFDFRFLDDNTIENRERIIPVKTMVIDEKEQVNVSKDCQIYEIKGVSGFCYMNAALDLPTQLALAYDCLSEYSNASHTNLTNLHQQQENLWKRCCETKDISIFSKLRWSSLGYHYNWTLRKYTKDDLTAFPLTLAQHIRQLAKRVGFDLIPEAAIVNFYPANSTMGGHVDDAELIKSKPIVSISLGNTAIFLLGGRTKQDVPVAVKVRSGDVIIMGGESRLCYHGVPLIIPGTGPFAYHNALKSNCDSSSSSSATHTLLSSEDCFLKLDIPNLDQVIAYLKENRLNINARQVEGDSPAESFQ